VGVTCPHHCDLCCLIRRKQNTIAVCISHPSVLLSLSLRELEARERKCQRACNKFISTLCEWRVNGVCKFSSPIYHCSSKIINNGGWLDGWSLFTRRQAMGAKYINAQQRARATIMWAINNTPHNTRPNCEIYLQWNFLWEAKKRSLLFLAPEREFRAAHNAASGVN